MAQNTLPDTVTLAVTDIKPYWNNPRRIGEQAVNAVKDSIEKFGYVQPILVDKDHVVISGHTRLQALVAAGAKEVEVYVTDLPEEKAREFRLVDNRTSELTTWNNEMLMQELREWDEASLEEYFPEMDLDLETGIDTSDIITNEDVEDATNNLGNVAKPKKEAHMTQVKCPSCFGLFEVRTDTLPGVTGDITNGGEA